MPARTRRARHQYRRVQILGSARIRATIKDAVCPQMLEVIYARLATNRIDAPLNVGFRDVVVSLRVHVLIHACANLRGVIGVPFAKCANSLHSALRILQIVLTGLHHQPMQRRRIAKIVQRMPPHLIQSLSLMFEHYWQLLTPYEHQRKRTSINNPPQPQKQSRRALTLVQPLGNFIKVVNYAQHLATFQRPLKTLAKSAIMSRLVRLKLLQCREVQAHDAIYDVLQFFKYCPTNRMNQRDP